MNQTFYYKLLGKNAVRTRSIIFIDLGKLYNRISRVNTTTCVRIKKERVSHLETKACYVF